MTESKSRAVGAETEIATMHHGRPVRGTVRITPQVLIELIELTVQDIDGVAGFRPLRNRGKSAPPEGGKSYDNGKVRVGIANDRIDADIAIRAAQGTNLTALSRAIQRRVALAVGQMLGMTVTEVNVYIDDIQPAETTGSTA